MAQSAYQPRVFSGRQAAPGSYDIWSLYDLDRGAELPCKDARRLLYFLASESTRKVTCMMYIPKNLADMTLFGPITDEAVYDLQDHGSCLTAKYRLTAEDLWNLDPRERSMLVDLVRAKRTNFSFDLWCRAMNVSRVR